MRSGRHGPEWLSQQLRFEEQRRRRLERERLQRERAQGFPFTDEDVLAALRAAYVDEPVATAEVARQLCGGTTPTTSAKIRAGQVLSRLAAARKVERVLPRPSGARLWRPVA